MEAVVGLPIPLKDEIAAATDVKTVRVVFRFTLGFLDLLESLQDVALLEVAPREVLIHSVVVLVVAASNLVRVLSLGEIALEFVENSDL